MVWDFVIAGFVTKRASYFFLGKRGGSEEYQQVKSFVEEDDLRV
jgi:hypothetical protein